MVAAVKVEVETAVYEHASKPEWGAGVIAWEAQGKRGYQFEDGTLRVFKQGYYHHLSQVDVTADRAAKLLKSARQAAAAPPASAGPPARKAITLDEQIDHFLAAYPAGFTAEPWRGEHRSAAHRGLKRHRDHAIAFAREELAPGRLEGWLAQAPEPGLRALGQVLTRTDLVAAAQVKPLVGLTGGAAGAVLAALRGMLRAEGPLATRFEAWVDALTHGLGRAPSWELATAGPALVQPEDHVCVHTPSFAAQATWMAPHLRFAHGPVGGLYVRALAMAIAIRDRLAERGAAPADLLDVHDFIGHAQRTKSRTEITAKRKRDEAEQASAPSEEPAFVDD